VFPVQKGIRLLGVTLSSLSDVLLPDKRQLRFEL
jgi:DNA polymerase-4